MNLQAQLQFQSADPITPDGGISAGWVLVICFGVIGGLILALLANMNKNNADAMNTFKEEIRNIHKRIDTRETEHDELEDQHGELRTRVLLVETTQKLHADNHAENTANLILSKLGVLQGNGNLEKHLKGPLFHKP